MKKLLTILIVLLALSGSAQTESLIIPGTKFSLIPPIGFTPATNFSGFQNSDINGAIMVSELPTSYFAMSTAFNAENLKSKGMLLKSKETVTLNGKEATLFTVSQEAN